MAEKSYTMDDLSLVKAEESVPLKRRSSQGDQPSRDNVSVNVVFFYDFLFILIGPYILS